MLSTTGENLAFRDREPHEYDFCLVASDAHTCTDTSCHTVVIDDVLFTYVPNTFTPDGDDVNDIWGMSSNMADIMNFHVWGFDRWGQVIHESPDPVQAWDGTAGGETVLDGVYPIGSCTS